VSKETELHNLMGKNFKKTLRVIVEMDLVHDNLHLFATMQGIFAWAASEAIIRHVDDELTQRLKNA